MRKRTWVFSLLGLVLGPVISTGSVRAGFETQTFTINPTLVGWSQSATFNQFNPAAGTLTQVTLSVAYTFSSTLQAIFTVPNTTTITVTTFDANMTLMAAGANTSLNIVLPAQGNFPSFIGQITETGTNASEPPSVVKTQTGTSALTLTPTNFSGNGFRNLFVGSGSFLLPMTANASGQFTTSTGNGAGPWSTVAGATITLTYFFTPNGVPEPPAFVLLALGGGGMVLVRWRRRLTRRW
jgi:hypothetical protein